MAMYNCKHFDLSCLQLHSLASVSENMISDPIDSNWHIYYAQVSLVKPNLIVNFILQPIWETEVLTLTYVVPPTMELNLP